MYHARISIFKIDGAKKEKEKEKKKRRHGREDTADKKEDEGDKGEEEKKQTHGVAMSQSGTSDVRGTGGSFPGRNL